MLQRENKTFIQHQGPFQHLTFSPKKNNIRKWMLLLFKLLLERSFPFELFRTRSRQYIPYNISLLFFKKKKSRDGN